MKTLIVLIALSLIFTGCAEMQGRQADSPNVVRFKQYVATNKDLAKAGTIKWSDYYKGLYDIVSADTNVPDAGFQMENLNMLISASLRYENGAITKDDFEYVQRQGTANAVKNTHALNQDAADRDAANRARALQYLQTQQLINNTRPTVTPYQMPKQTNCRSNAVGNTVYTNCN